MVSTFVDTGYLVAIAHERDQWHAAALAARKRLGSTPLVTTDEVLVEFLAAFSSAGRVRRTHSEATGRQNGTRYLDVAQCDRRSTVSRVIPRWTGKIRESRGEGVQSGRLRFHECSAGEGITRALTNDHHFEQEGFTVLMSRSDELPTSSQNSG